MDFSARLAGLKILARFENTGLGFSTRAELRPGLNPSPCNRQLGFLRICFRSRAEISARGETHHSCGYTCLLPKVTLWVIALGWDRFGFPVRFSPPVTLQIITQGQLLTWQYLKGNLIHHGDRKPRNIRLACGCSSVLLLIRQYPVDLAIQNFVL